MKKIIKKYFVLSLALCLTMSLSGVSAMASEITEAQKKQQELETQQKDIKDILADLETKKSNTLEYIEELDMQLTSLETRIDELETQIGEVETELEQTKIEVEQAKEDEQNQYDAMKKRIQCIYMQGNTEYIQILVNADSIADFLNRSEYIKKISEYDKNMLTNYQEAKQLVLDKEASLEEQKTSLEEMNTQLEEEKNAVQILIDDKNKELANYNASISQSQSQITNLQAEIEAQEQLVEELLEAERKRIEEEERKRKEAEEAARKAAEEEAKKQNSSNSGSSSSSGSSSITVSSGGYLWPVPSSGRITSYFGHREQPTAGASTYHKGIDVGAPTGSNIVATKSGTVVTSRYSSSAGYYIMIYHGNGVYSTYMHCSKLLASVGDEVSRGEVIALVGSTGYSTGPHLHFAITIGGTYVNPLKYVSP